jgi:hypothetical protein
MPDVRPLGFGVPILRLESKTSLILFPLRTTGGIQSKILPMLCLTMLAPNAFVSLLVGSSASESWSVSNELVKLADSCGWFSSDVGRAFS